MLNIRDEGEIAACPGLMGELAGVISPIAQKGGSILRAAQLRYLSDFVAGDGAMKAELG